VKFVGRDEELRKLHQFLQENHQVAIAAILGMGGLGKTELALQYAISQLHLYTSKLWHSGDTCWEKNILMLPKA
jgi:hypothetical protein